ncbi:MAG: 3,4-dihydroxy-2-butanone-4-phosphate synthase [Alphaproteobacteria bacterium]
MTEGRLDSVEAAIEGIARGDLVVVVDDADRENEGDLIMAAAKATPEAVAFMVRHTSGILCAPVTRHDAHRLRLDPMVQVNDAPLGTAFTVSVDYREGLTTGISADERCNTVRALANPNVGAHDFVRPGHVFPLVARDGGVLVRSGHTEAAVDLARMADLPAVGLLAELVNDDGTVKRLSGCRAFAREHGLRIIAVADIIAYRLRREHLVERLSSFEVMTPAGSARGYLYGTRFDPHRHLVLVFGAIGTEHAIPVRIHREDVLSDAFGPRDGPHASVLARALERLAGGTGGVLVYLREGSAGVPVQPVHGEDALDDGGRPGRTRDEEWREIGVGAQILRDLGVTSMRLLATQRRRYVGLEGFGIAIEGTDILDA